MLKKSRMVPWLSMLFALLVAILLPNVYAEGQSVPPAKTSEVSASPAVYPALMICNSPYGWSCWKQYRRFAGAAAYKEFLAAAKGVVFDKEGNPIGQAEIKNWNKHSYGKLWVLAPQVVADTKSDNAPNAIKLTPIAKDSSLQFADFVRIAPSPLPKPVAAVPLPNPKELVTSLPLHERFTGIEQRILGTALLIFLMLLVVLSGLYVMARRTIKKLSSAEFERKTPKLDEYDHSGCSQAAHTPKFDHPKDAAAA